MDTIGGPGQAAETTMRVFKPAHSYVISGPVIYLEPKRILSPGWLLVEDGRIKEVGEGMPPIRPGSQTISLDRQCVVSGLIDAHVHLALNPRGPALNEKIELAATYGLAAVRDGGDRTCALLHARKEAEFGLTIAASGTALFAPGRYGSFLGRPVRSRAEMCEAVKELADGGADQIKILASGPVNLDNWAQTGPPQFSQSDLVYLAGLARDRGLDVMAHANGPEAVKMCIQAGAASVEHGYFMGPEALELLAESQIYWAPTIEPLAALLGRETGPERRDMIERIIVGQIEQLSRARELGVQAVLGTDAGSPGVQAGPALSREAAWWLKAGFSYTEVLEAATIRGAALLGRVNDLGRLTPGSLAYVVGFPPIDRTIPNILERPAFVGRPAWRETEAAAKYNMQDGSNGDGHDK